MRITVVAGLLMILTVQVPASARTLHVPSEYPTIQQAVDAAAASGDTILVAAGSYPEHVVITSKSVDVVGAGREVTSVASFLWDWLNYGDPNGGSLTGFHVDGSVVAQLSLNFTLNQSLVEGSTALSMSSWAFFSASAAASIFQGPVTIAGASDPECLPFHAWSAQDCEFYANIDVSRQCQASISGCVFHGNAGCSVSGYQRATVTNNTFIGTGGISARASVYHVTVSDNILSGGGISTSSIGNSVVSRNTGARGISGDVGGGGSFIIEDNVLHSGNGISTLASHATIQRNVVMGCTRGISVDSDGSTNGSIDGNTVYACTGTGIYISPYTTSNQIVVERNLITGNARGIDYPDPPDQDHILCNDVFDNPGGNWIGADYSGTNGNFAADPFFCSPENGDLTLAANSPCLPENGACGLVGALGEGCLDMGACCQGDGTCALTTEANCQALGIWQGAGVTCDPNPCLLGACCLYVACEVYSPDNCASHGGVFMGNGTLCEPNPCVSGVEDASQVTSLSLIATPNPSTGQVMIRYSLPKPTVVTIEVFNAAGGLVRRIAEGTQQAGQHAMDWDGRDQGGNDLPSGIYLARRLTAEGTTTGRVVLAR